MRTQQLLTVPEQVLLQYLVVIRETVNIRLCGLLLIMKNPNLYPAPCFYKKTTLTSKSSSLPFSLFLKNKHFAQSSLTIGTSPSLKSFNYNLEKHMKEK